MAVEPRPGTRNGRLKSDESDMERKNLKSSLVRKLAPVIDGRICFGEFVLRLGGGTEKFMPEV